MREKIVAISLLTLVASAGCCGHGKTSLTAMRVPGAESTPALPAKAGIPFQLTKPEFTLTESPPSDKNPNTSYTINLLYRPDPAQRFLININPRWLHEGDLKLSLGKQGQLRQVNTETREQLTPQIKAIGTFVAGAIGTIAKFAAFDVSSEVNRIFRRVEKEGRKVYQEGLEDDHIPEATDFRASSPAEEEGLKDLKERLKSFKTTKEMLAKFYPRASLEVLWLRTARARAKQEAASFQKGDETARTALEKYYDDRKVEFVRKVNSPKQDVDRIDNAVSCGDSEDLKKLKEEQIKAAGQDKAKTDATDALFKAAEQMADKNKNDYDKMMACFISAVKPLPKDVDKIDPAIRLGDSELLTILQKQQEGAILLKKQQEIEKQYQDKQKKINNLFTVATKMADLYKDVQFIDKLLKLPDRDWRNRHAEYLEGQIAALEQEAIFLGGELPPLKQAKLMELRQQWARTVNVVEEQKRAEMLNKFLKEEWHKADVALPSSTLNSPAFNNYEIARKEYEAVLTTIQQKRAVLKPTAEAPKLIQRELRPKELRWYPKDKKDEKSNAGWVLEQVRKTTKTPCPNSS